MPSCSYSFNYVKGKSVNATQLGTIMGLILLFIGGKGIAYHKERQLYSRAVMSYARTMLAHQQYRKRNTYWHSATNHFNLMKKAQSMHLQPPAFKTVHSLPLVVSSSLKKGGGV